MRYMGSKRRFVKELVPILMSNVGKDTLFVDAFCGGCNVLCAIPHPNKVGIDINRYMTEFWKDAISEYISGVPFTCMSSDYTEEVYHDVRDSYRNGDGRYKDSFIGFVATAGSWGGGWFKGYPRYNPNKNEDHIREAYDGVVKQLSKWLYLGSTRIENLSYDQFDYPPNSVIYCDPPYKGTQGYKEDERFDHEKFWEWARKMTREGHHVYISEYEAPEDFRVIWSAKKKDGLADYAGRKQNVKIEKLYVWDKEKADSQG